MLKRKLIFLFFITMVAVALMFGATRVGATCSPEELSAATCLSAGGIDVRTSASPVQNADGTVIFNYTITGSLKNLSTIDMLIPVCKSDFNYDGVIDNLIQLSTGDPNGWRVYQPGQGSSNTNFGAGVQAYVFEQNFNSFSSIYLHTSKAASGVTSMGLKVGSTLYSGSILGPSCYEPKTAATVEQVIQLDPLIPSRFVTVLKDADGTLLQVLDENNQPLPMKNLSDSPVWVCVDPILDSSGNYQGCNTAYNPLTYMPEGVGRFGKHTCYTYAYLGKLCTRCYTP